MTVLTGARASFIIYFYGIFMLFGVLCFQRLYYIIRMLHKIARKSLVIFANDSGHAFYTNENFDLMFYFTLLICH